MVVETPDVVASSLLGTDLMLVPAPVVIEAATLVASEMAESVLPVVVDFADVLVSVPFRVVLCVALVVVETPNIVASSLQGTDLILVPASVLVEVAVLVASEMAEYVLPVEGDFAEDLEVVGCFLPTVLFKVALGDALVMNEDAESGERAERR